MSSTPELHWVTHPAIVHWQPVDVFHRQLDKKVFEIKEDEQNLHILFRKEFELENFNSAQLLITADDCFKLYINGKFVTIGPAPGYPSRYFYAAIDVTPYLVPGRNVIAIHTFYQGLINRVWVSGDKRHGLACRLNVDGKKFLESDSGFLCSFHSGFRSCGVTGYSTQILEHYDANAPENGFEAPGFDDSKWLNAAIKNDAAYKLVLQPSKQLVFEEIKPETIVRNGNRTIVDFGAVNVGYLRFSASGKAGSTIEMLFAQELNSDNSLRWNLRANCNYKEFFTLSGGVLDTLNEFDYKSIRYVELITPEGCDVDVDSIVFIRRHYPFELKRSCRYSDEKSLKIWQLCCDTLHYGVQEVIQDCMEREKGYYLGDGCYTIWSHALLTDDFTLVEKFFDDFFGTSFINRGLMTCGCCSMMQEIAEYPFMFIMLAWMYLAHTGRADFIRSRYAKFADILDFYCESYSDGDGLLRNLDKWCVVEWPPQYRDGYDVDITEGKVCVAKHIAVNAYYIGAVKSLNKIASTLGLPPYKDESALVKSFVKAFYLPEKRLFRDSTETNHTSFPGNIFSAFFGLIPDEECKENIVRLIDEKRFSCCNLFTTLPAMAFLAVNGREDLIKSLLHDENAWLNIIKEDGRRTFEGWGKDCKWNTSLFHLTMSFGVLFLTEWGMAEILDFR